MTSWTECGCGGDVILYEQPNVEMYGHTWPLLLTGNCKLCGRYHETVPLSMRAEFEKARAVGVEDPKALAETRQEMLADADTMSRDDFIDKWDRTPDYIGHPSNKWAVGCSGETLEECIADAMKYADTETVSITRCDVPVKTITVGDYASWRRYRLSIHWWGRDREWNDVYLYLPDTEAVGRILERYRGRQGFRYTLEEYQNTTQTSSGNE